MRPSEHSRIHTIERLAKGNDSVPWRPGLPRKLTDLQVREARKQYENGINPTRLSKMYSIHRETMKDILNRKTYKDVI